MKIKMRRYPWEDFVWVYVFVAAMTKEAAPITCILPQKIFIHPAYVKSTACILIFVKAK